VPELSVTIPPVPQVTVVAVGARGPQGPAAPSFHGQISRTTPGTVTISDVGAYVTTGLTATLDGEADGFSLGVNDKCGLRNTSGSRLLARFYGSADVQAGNNHVVGMKFAVNGVSVAATECRSHTGIGAANFAKTVSSWMLAVDPGDEVSLFIADFTSAGTATVQRCRLLATTVAVLD
jgi:hypothetical protein